MLEIRIIIAGYRPIAFNETDMFFQALKNLVKFCTMASMLMFIIGAIFFRRVQPIQYMLLLFRMSTGAWISDSALHEIEPLF